MGWILQMEHKQSIDMKRYEPCEFGSGMEVDPDGDYVKFIVYQDVKLSHEQTRKELEEAKDIINIINEIKNDYQAKLAALEDVVRILHQYRNIGIETVDEFEKVEDAITKRDIAIQASRERSK